MLRTLSLLALVSAAAGQDSCQGAAAVNIGVCSDEVPGKDTSAVATSLNPPAWNCAATELRVGEVVPMLVDVTNICKNTDKGNELNRDVYVNAEMVAGSSITVKFACLGGCTSGQLSDVIVYAGLYTAIAAGTKIEGVLLGANEAAIQIPDIIPLPIEDDTAAADAVDIGTIFCRAAGYPNPPGSQLSTKASSSENAVAVDDASCLPAVGDASGTTSTKFLVSPPPPPPPPDCCTKDSRNCLARCEDCVGNPGGTDEMGEACNKYCTTDCPVYPNADTEKCFDRCLECSKEGEITNDKEGEPCAAFCDTSCSDYYKCIKAETCALGCAEGRRDRKLLFAAIPACAPCCKPNL